VQSSLRNELVPELGRLQGNVREEGDSTRGAHAQSDERKATERSRTQALEKPN